jgi:hypothetical protein
MEARKPITPCSKRSRGCAAGRAALAVPENLRQMIEVQIERLTPEEQGVLEVASLTQHRAFSVIARAAAALDGDPDLREGV